MDLASSSVCASLPVKCNTKQGTNASSAFSGFKSQLIAPRKFKKHQHGALDNPQANKSGKPKNLVTV